MIQKGDTQIVIDTGPDFRQQMLLAKTKKLDAVVFTHEHKDHVAGLDDIRAFNFKSGGKAMDVFATARVQEALKREFSYVFEENKYPGVPEVRLFEVENELFQIGEMNVIPIDVMHHKLPIKAYRIDDFAYVTDANYISPEEKKKLMGLEVLILTALRKEKHLSHYNLEEAIAVVRELKPKKAYFTHISHLMGKHQEVQAELPEGVELAYDGLEIRI